MDSNPDRCHGIEDHVLVAQIARGDEAAFNCLYGRHFQPLMAWLCARVSQPDAEDILQDIWITLRTKPPTDDRHQIRSWLFTVTRNRLKDFYRGRKNRGAPLPEQVEGKMEGDYLSVDAQKRMRDLSDCVSELEEDFREPLVKWMQGVEHELIAESLRIPVATSHTRVGRAKSKVKACMQNKGWTE